MLRSRKRFSVKRLLEKATFRETTVNPNGQTKRHTDTLITILRTSTAGEIMRHPVFTSQPYIIQSC